MTKIIIKTDYDSDYIIDLSREFEGYEQGDILCYVKPFIDVPITLHIAIRRNGNIVFRSWSWNTKTGNGYLHLYDTDAEKYINTYGNPTQDQIDTVNGLFSGRIKFDGLKLAVGATLQQLCPIDVKREEELTGHTIYLT